MHYSLQPDGPLPEDDLGFMKKRLKAHLDLAEAAMVEAAQSIHADEPDAESKYKRFFKARLSTLIELTIKKFPESAYQAAIKRYKGAFRVKLEELVESLVYAKNPMPYSLPSNYKRWTVAKWIMSFAHSECRKSGREIRNIDNFYESTKGNDLYRQDPDHSQFWDDSRQILADLNKLVYTIKNMANEFVEMLQADGKSTEQKQSVVYELYTKDFMNIM